MKPLIAYFAEVCYYRCMYREFEMLLAEKPLNMIAAGQKTVEVRLYDEKRRKLNVGDTIKFFCREDESRFLIAKVTFLRRFATFEELYCSELATAAGMGKMTATEAAESMYEYYSREQEAHFGVLAIGLKVDTNSLCRKLRQDYSTI